MANYLTHNWRSTLAGVAMILSAVARMHGVADLAQSDTQAQLLAGVGLICAADARHRTPPAPPTT